MGLLDQILGAALRNQARSGGGLGGLGDLLGGRAGTSSRAGGGNLLMSLLPLVVMMLQGRNASAGGSGGLGGLLGQLQAAGLGQQADSWVSSGANLPVSAEDLSRALGPDTISQLAAQAGVPEDEVSGGLAQLLPEVVDQLTPGGRMPASDQVDTALDDLTRSLGI